MRRVDQQTRAKMYNFETLKRDFRWLLPAGIVGALLIMSVMQVTGEIALPGELFEKPIDIVSGFLLLTVMIGFIAEALRSVTFVVSKWGRRTLVSLGVIGFAVPMVDIGGEGGVTLMDIYEVILPGFLLAALLIAIPQLLVAVARRIRTGLTKEGTAG